MCGGRERSIDMRETSVASCTLPNQGSNLQSKYVEMEPTTFWCTGPYSSPTEPPDQGYNTF